MAKQLSLKYHHSKKYNHADGGGDWRKENDENDSDSAQHNSLQPVSSSLTARPRRPKDKQTMPIRSKVSEYNTANMHKAREKREKKMTSSTTSSCDVNTSTNANTNTKKNTSSTAESGLQQLGLLRPIDNKSYEFGMATGIQLHLIESVKLSGLKQRREKAIVDMISTLCNHLKNRESDISRWIEHSDLVALTAAIKLEESVQKYKAVCASRDEARHYIEEDKLVLVEIQQQVCSLQHEFREAKDGVLELLESFPPVISKFERQIRAQITSHQDSLQSECKAEVSDTVEELKTVHDIDKQRLETVIGSLEMSVVNLQHQLDDTVTALKKKKNDNAELKVTLDQARDELKDANQKIRVLEDHIETEKLQKKKHLAEAEERFRDELCDVDRRVKASFKRLEDDKNTEIKRALAKAHEAEISAKASQKLLLGLQQSIMPVLPKVASSAEASNEN